MKLSATNKWLELLWDNYQKLAIVYCESSILIGWKAMVYELNIWTTNMLGVHVFIAMIVAHFEVFLWVSLIQQLFHLCLFDIR